ncbi:hypothetical protein FPK15_contig00122-0001 [Flavobacterium psychrophilum]|nr:hypothetical protein FPK15_contig00122-0001 [Flavobacterium psychrophilum]GAW90789.1 hypothetical protein FPS14_contig00115-0002 [Flavobacterium psychrophilum]
MATQFEIEAPFVSITEIIFSFDTALYSDKPSFDAEKTFATEKV